VGKVLVALPLSKTNVLREIAFCDAEVHDGAMHKQIRMSRAVFLMACAIAAGQTGPTLTGSGYAVPTNVRVAPGQITTLFVTGLEGVLPLGLRPTKSAYTKSTFNSQALSRL